MNLSSEISATVIQRTATAAVPAAAGITDTPLAAVIVMSVSEEAIQPFAIFATKWQEQNRPTKPLPQNGKNEIARRNPCHKMARTKSPDEALATKWQERNRPTKPLPQNGKNEITRRSPCHKMARTKSPDEALATKWQQTNNS